MSACGQDYVTTKKSVFHDSSKYENYPVDTANYKPSICYPTK